MLAQAHFSAKRLHGANQSAMQEMLWSEKGINFDKEPIGFKRGRCVVRVERSFESERGTGIRRPWEIDHAVLVFGRHREYIEQHLMNEPKSARTDV
jgi:tRNA(His) 5'-end guanylyltransferase